MIDIRSLTILDLHELYVAKKVTPLEVVQEALKLAKEDKNNAIEYLMEKEALEQVSKLGEPEKDNLLWGIPFFIKDNMSTKDVPSTASSNILNGYVPVYDAAVVEKLYASKAIALGKSTLDELAMGGTGTTGHLGMTYNPFDSTKTRLIGGSSCGSAALTSAGIVPFSLGSDTGDSIRKPASFAGLVGFKPTWSRISRYGLFPFAPSLDTVGVFTRSVIDAGILLQVLAGRDERDSTSSARPVENYLENIEKPVEGYRVAVIKQIYDSLKDEECKKMFDKTLDMLKTDNVVVEFVDMPMNLLESLYPTYFVISCAEATSNNANLDGIKFGPYYDGKTYEEVMSNARTKGFSELIKRRFVFGSFGLMSENQKDLFVRAQRNRRRIVDEINKIFAKYDFIYLPAAPSIAPKVDDNTDHDDEEFMVLDNHLSMGNFGGFPSITLPIGFKEGMPFGANFMGRAFEDAKVLQICYSLEKKTGLKGTVKKGE